MPKSLVLTYYYRILKGQNFQCMNNSDVSELLFFQNWKEKSEVNFDLLMFSNSMLDFVLLAYHPALVRLTVYHF